MLLARQTSALSAFRYDLLSDDGRALGRLRWPDLAVAKNARLRDLVPENLSTAIELELNGKGYSIEFEYRTRGWTNDLRFCLKDAERTLATADHTTGKGGAKTHLLEPFEAELRKKPNLFAARFEVVTRDGVIGSIAEPMKLTARRELVIRLPETVAVELQGFLVFLVCNRTFR